MRILQVANFVSPTSGGIRTALAAWAQGYRLAGHDVAALVPDAGGDPALWWPEHPRVLTVPGVPAGAGYRLVVRRKELLAAIAAFAPDVVELSDRTTLAWLPGHLARAGVPSVVVAHEHVRDVLRQVGAPRPLGDRVAQRVALAGAGSLVVAPSRYAAGESARLGRDVRVVALGVDTALFRPVPRAAGFDAGPLRLLHVGRLSREKRPLLSVETLRVLLERGVDAELTVLGGGPLGTDLVRAAAGLPVEVLGHRPPAEVAATMARSDVVIAPAPAETFGLAALEALACGTPVVCPTSGALPEVVAEGGRTCWPTPEAFADAVVDLAADPAARERARRRALTLTWSASASAMLRVHAEVTQSPGLHRRSRGDAPRRSDVGV